MEENLIYLVREHLKKRLLILVPFHTNSLLYWALFIIVVFLTMAWPDSITI